MYLFLQADNDHRFWRKTRKPNTGISSCIGTDPNRNWDYKWGCKYKDLWLMHCDDIHKRKDSYKNLTLKNQGNLGGDPAGDFGGT